MIRGIIIFALLGVALAASSANQYMDNVLYNSLPNQLRSRGLNPALLPAFMVPFGYPKMAQANFYNGNATVAVRRYSDCQGPRLAYGELTINCTLSLSPITTSYNVRVINGSQVYNGRSTGHAGETLVSVVIAGRPQNYVGSVKQFQILRLTPITITFSGLPQSFSRYTQALQDGFRNNISNYLVSLLQSNFVYALGGALAYTPMPRQ